ncbi:MAG: hypothetical protein H6739_28375 [Alphaproteobacteria bacterium]|nr:hypothetical protein [Alphaproteobacteria bacterium]
MPRFLPLLVALSACAVAPEGLRLTPEGAGPVVRVDWDAEPLPDIPYPNDLATRPDPTSPTGLRLNVSTETVIEAEAEVRRKINSQLSGFGVYAPITVAFEGRLDLEDLASRHAWDPRTGAAQFDDDAVFVINVDPDSPDYLQPIELDLGQGRFPMDAARSDRYFPNDPRATDPSVIFESTDEDLNGNGVLDWGEDTDNDGVLDKPNVFPEDGDPRYDLLSWYELQSDTLILRAVIPMHEETTYAVVLTERLMDEDGQPVRSPWEYVNHTAQTQALEPLADALPGLGLSVDDVAFAWTFTTGRITGDLVDLRQAVDGEGPYGWLAEDYPPGVYEAAAVQESEGPSHWLDASRIMETVFDLGLLDPDAGIHIEAVYGAFGDAVVGGVFTTPNLLVDKDDGGHDDSEELWVLDPMTGEAEVEGERVAFTCVLPKEREGVQQPFPVAVYGHGYGSSRFEFLGFGYAFARFGVALCAMDFPGHGPSLGPDEELLAQGILGSRGLASFLEHIFDSRQRDLDNDGRPDSGGDQWSADAFHTRDMVRQAALDWIWLFESFKRCGEGEMTLPDGGTAVSCDWSGDGVPDIGGPDNTYYLLGGSLGGINAAVAAPVLPDVKATVPVVPGGGLLDVGIRTEIGGAVEAMVGRLISPLILGLPNEDGSLAVVQMVNSVTDMRTIPIATLDSFPAGGRILVENLDSGESHEGYVPEDGRFRVAIAADAANAAEKRILTGMPDDDPSGTWTVEDNLGLGDRLRLTFETADGQEVAVIDTFEADVVHEGVTYPAGSPLVAGNEGFGHTRGTPEVRRVALSFAAILEPGDPIAYAPYYQTGLPGATDGPLNVLLVPSIGDTIVPLSGGLALSRAAGFIDRETPIPEYGGLTEDQWLIAEGVVQGLEQWGPYRHGNPDEGVTTPILFDPDDVDRNYGAPSNPDRPLRATVETSAGISGMRLPYVRPTGTHGFGLPEPDLDFDINLYAIYQMGGYLSSGATQLVDDPCLEDASCSWIPQVEDAR